MNVRLEGPVCPRILPQPAASDKNADGGEGGVLLTLFLHDDLD